MKKIVLAFVVAVATAAVASALPAHASTTRSQAKATHQKAAVVKSHTIKAEVVSTDAAAKSITVKESDGSNETLTASGGAVASLAKVKAGDWVTITANETTATRIVKAKPMKATAGKKGGRTRQLRARSSAALRGSVEDRPHAPRSFQVGNPERCVEDGERRERQALTGDGLVRKRRPVERLDRDDSRCRERIAGEPWPGRVAVPQRPARGDAGGGDGGVDEEFDEAHGPRIASVPIEPRSPQRSSAAPMPAGMRSARAASRAASLVLRRIG